MRNIFIIFLSLLGITTFSQTYSGIVSDTKGEALPYVNVYFEGTSIGTTTNTKGEFTLALGTNQKASVLIAQFVGFEKKKINLSSIDPNKKITIKLNEQALQIKEVTVAFYKRDKAYYIIKQAQKKRKTYLNAVNQYSCDIYMKGATRLLDKPEKLPAFLKLGIKQEDVDSMKTGLLALSESVAKVHYLKGKGIKEEMIASKVSGQSQSFSWNRADQVLTNFYEERIKMAGLNERGFVSPIASDALLYYDFKLLGTFIDDDQTINKIAVTPKRKGDPIFNGTIYIVEDSWNIHSLNLKVAKESQIEFIDSISISQNFTKIRNETYLPLSLQATYSFGFFGFRASYDAIGNISNYDLERSYPENFFNNEVFSVKDSANKKDTAFWQDLRPVVLSEEENTNYTLGDSISKIQNSKPYLDSLDRISNKFRLFSAVSNGYNLYLRYDSLRYTINSVISGLQYTAVDGLAIELNPKRRKETPNGERNTEIGLRYGFASERIGLKLRQSELLNRKNYARYFIEGGYYTNQINEAKPISAFGNSYYSLFYGKNLAQFYQKLYLKLGYGQEIINGIRLNGSTEIAFRQNLDNEVGFSLGAKHDIFTPNLKAINNSTNDLLNQQNGVVKFNLEANIIFKQKYATYPNRKVNYSSKYPKLNIRYQLGFSFDTLSQSKPWHLLELEVFDRQSLGMIGAGEYSIKAGNYFGIKPQNLADFKHFNGNRTLFLQTENNSFQNLPYYSLSTNKAYLEAHYEHHFYGFLLNKIPLVKKLKFKEVAGINFLYLDGGAQYTEVYAGIENIFTVFRVDIVSPLLNGKLQNPVIRFGLRLN